MSIRIKMNIQILVIVHKYKNTQTRKGNGKGKMSDPTSKQSHPGDLGNIYKIIFESV